MWSDVCKEMMNEISLQTCHLKMQLWPHNEKIHNHHKLFILQQNSLLAGIHNLSDQLEKNKLEINEKDKKSLRPCQQMN